MAKKAVNGWHHPQEPLCPAQSRGDVVYKLNNFFTCAYCESVDFYATVSEMESFLRVCRASGMLSPRASSIIQ